jgi:TolB-like protein/DNA-binding winged helix-turn-helix (wHTH) protein
VNAPISKKGSIAFDRFELRLDSNELFKGGRKLKLKPQAAKVLGLLLRRAGEAAHRDEIRDELWGADTFVDFDRSLNSCIAQLRTALGDDPAAPRFIETVPKHGYRFMAPLGTEETPKKRKAPAVASLLAAGVLCALAALIWSAMTAPERAMLLVRPFENLGGEAADDFIGEGLTEELITRLAGIAPEKVAVYGRTTAMRFDELHEERSLELDYLIEGSFHRENERLRITARLVDASDGTSLWTDVYERPASDLLAVQAEVAARIADSLVPDVPREVIQRYSGSTHSATAHEAYLQGRHHLAEMSRDGLGRAAEAFERAVVLDPRYARAWAGLADAYNLMPWWGGMKPSESAQRARDAAEKALAIEPGLAEGHDALGFVSLYHDFDAREAETRFRRALEREPGLAMTHYWYAGLLSATGRHDAAIAAIREAQEIDPLSPLVNADAGWYYFYARRYPEAIRECRRILELSPSYGWAQSCINEAALQSAQEQEAIRGFESLARILSAPREIRERLTKAASAKDADRVLSQWQLEGTEEGSQAAYRSSLLQALLRLRVDDPAGALEAIEDAYQERDSFLVHAGVDPRLDPLRGEERFQAIVSKLGVETHAAGLR